MLWLKSKLNTAGPRCVFSICSLPGIAWVNEKIKVQGFQESAYRYSKDITRRLKIEQKISKVRAAEPGRQAAWDYVTGALSSTVNLRPRLKPNRQHTLTEHRRRALA